MYTVVFHDLLKIRSEITGDITENDNYRSIIKKKIINYQTGSFQMNTLLVRGYRSAIDI